MFTPKSQRLSEIGHKAIIFRHTWTLVKNIYKNDPKKIKKNYDDGKLNNIFASKTFACAETYWDSFKSNLYTINHMDRFKILWAVENQLAKMKADNTLQGRSENLLWCSECDVLDAMRKICSGNDKNTITKKCCNLHTAFYHIGREHKWGDKQYITERGEPFACSGNLATDSTKDTLLKEFDHAMKKKEQDALENGDIFVKKKPKSKGGSATIPLVSWYIQKLLAELLELSDDFKSSNKQSVRTFINRGQLNLLLIFLMHTGARPSNIFDHLKHDDLYFNGTHEKIYWLTLVFLKASTLKFIIDNDILQKLIMKINNGNKTEGKKYRQPYLSWQKDTIPTPYNILDLPFMFAIIWRIIMQHMTVVDIQINDMLVFKNISFSDNFRDRNVVFGIKSFVLYSMRYGITKEEFEGNIVPEVVIRKRMTHSEESSTAKDVYAACDKTISFDDLENQTETETQLPSPEFNKQSQTMGYVWEPLEKNGMCYDTTFLSKF